MTKEQIREEVAKQLIAYEFCCDIDKVEENWGTASEDERQDWLSKADQILSIKGVRIECENQELPLTKMEKFLQDYGDLEILDNGERIRHISVCYPKAPRTRLSIEGEVIASKLRHELDAQQDMLKEGWVKCKVKEEQ